MRLIVPLLVGCLALGGCDRQKAAERQGTAPTPAPNGASIPARQEAGKGIDRSHAGAALPDIVVKDGDGEDTALTEFKGKPLLVNLWASWCAPCVEELPTLEKLEASHAIDGQLGVIAVSQDSAPKGSVDAFLAEKKIGKFAAFRDPDMALTSALGVQIMPTTILYDAAGKEVWRFTGDLDWTGAEATKLLSEISRAAIR